MSLGSTHHQFKVVTNDSGPKPERECGGPQWRRSRFENDGLRNGQEARVHFSLAWKDVLFCPVPWI